MGSNFKDKSEFIDVENTCRELVSFALVTVAAPAVADPAVSAPAVGHHCSSSFLQYENTNEYYVDTV
ncbi:hypothetical protein RIF29_24952 [Crotalaria pallida]|uniref:Uncharacterized protein n=1 Tax=Crotalaria pallida TaxID=3830 RepID=A0AAN9ELF5_CROPI